MAIGSIGDAGAKRIGRPIKRSGRSIKNGVRDRMEFNRQLQGSGPKPGSSIKRYERAIILFIGKDMQEEAMSTSST